MQDSNFEQLESELWKFLNHQQGSILLLRALKQLSQSIAEMNRPLMAEWEIYQEKTRQDASTKEHQLREAQDKLQGLLEDGASWRTQLNDGLVDIRSSVLSAFQEGFMRIKYQAEIYTDDARLLAIPGQIISLLEADADALMTQLHALMKQEVSALQSEVEASTGLSLGLIPIDTFSWEKSDFDFDEKLIKRTGWWDKTLSTVAQGTYKASIGAILGGLFGGVVGSILGPAGTGAGATLGYGLGSSFAAIAGFGSGAKQALEQMKEREKHSVLRITSKLLAEMQQSCQATLNEAIKVLERSSRDELTSKIRQEQNSCKRSIQAMVEARKLTQEQVSQKVATLKVPLQQFSQLGTTVNQLAETIFKQREETVNPSSSNH